MSRIQKMAALVLAAVCMLAALAGCGEKKEPERKKTDVELITGRWETAFDVSETVKEQAAALDNLFADADFTGLGLPYQITFNADGTYTAGIPADGAQRLLRDAAARMAVVMKEQTRRELAEQQHVKPEEIGDEQLDGYVGMIGYGTWEDMCLERLEAIDLTALLETESITGKYALKDGLLCLSGDAATEAAAAGWSSPYQLDGKTLTLSGGDTDGLPGFVTFPATFSRIGRNG